MTASTSPRPLLRDPTFWTVNFTQFFGAFNDNLFKELILLLCVSYATAHGGGEYQGLAQTLFCAPFLLLSGFAGYVADRFSKRTIIVICKVAEILLAGIGVVGFALMNIPLLMVLLCLMGIHSAMFGPPKYGILPELFRKSDLPRANGLILMNTFVAIILGFAAAGALAHYFQQSLWVASTISVVVGILGLTTALFLRDPGPASPNEKFAPEDLFISRTTWGFVRREPGLLSILISLAGFYVVVGMVYPAAINELAKVTYDLQDLYAGMMAACAGIGIALGCPTAGLLCRERIRPLVIRLGLIGMGVCMVMIGFPGPRHTPLLGVPLTHVALVGLGFFAGWFTAPIQIYLQAVARDGEKGRIIGAMNVFVWTGLTLSGIAYSTLFKLLKGAGYDSYFLFPIAALLLWSLLLVVRPPRLSLKDPAETPLGHTCNDLEA